VTLSEVIKLAARGDGVTADGRHVALAAPGDISYPMMKPFSK